MKKTSLRNGIYAALAGVAMIAGTAQAASVNVAQILTGTNNWYRTNIYTLNGAAFVMSNAVLNIEAGTVIKGHNLGGQGTNVAALYITPGAKIYAEGTPHHPIIFTADVDDTTLPDDMPIWGSTARGLWGGLVIFGNSVLNGAIDAGGNALPLGSKYEVYEGLTDITVSGQQVFRFGGSNDDDNSGILRYVSIRHGGAVLAPNKEINGLSLGAVGRGTTIEYVESYCAADDGFEFFGGTVNTKYLVSSFNDDDSFDTDMGYRGTNQFWFAVQAPDKRNYGMELNNHPNELSQASQLTPAADFKVYNLTIIGAGSAGNTNVNGGANHAIALRPWVGPKIYNAIFTDFNGQGVLADTQNGVIANQAITNGYAQLHNTLWWNFTAGSGSTNISNTITNLGRNTVATNYWNDTTLTNQIANPQLVGISRTNVGTLLDPRPQAGSAAFSDYATTPNDGFLTQVNYRGAFGSNDLWIANWTALSEYGILQQPSVNTNNVSQILTGTNYWYRTNIYVLNGAAFVMSNSVLNIEAGTVIKGHNLGGQGTNVAALYITPGAKIYAEGTPHHPIIFTADVDDTTLPDDMPIWGSTARGLWGGLVIFGNSVLNGAIDAGGNALPLGSKYEVYEGLTDITVSGQQVFRFGGSNDDDNSGILRYVSIRHGGAVLAPNKEINGLSLGAVGRGTTIEYVESYCAADDGFEFFGGTVNTKYLVSSFNDDDSFDTDMGYRGTNQFWFAVQAPDKRNYGMELNNHPNELSQASQLTPAADFKVYNLTIIGAGSAGNTNVNGGANHAIALRPWVGPKIYNAIFTDFNGQGVLADTQNGVIANQAITNGYAQLHNTLWWNFTAGSGSTNISNTITNLGRNTVATNYWNDTTLTNQIANPQLVGISRTNVGTLLDPRPQAGSVASSNSAATPANLTAANYRGAFGPGRGNWAADWTALSEYGITGGAGGVNLAASSAAVVVTPNQPFLAASKNGGNLNIVFTSQSGVTYQLQSTTNLGTTPIVWTDEGSTIPGTGGSLTSSVPTSASVKLFRVKAQ